jgi:hypothetical protein
MLFSILLYSYSSTSNVTSVLKISQQRRGGESSGSKFVNGCFRYCEVRRNLLRYCLYLKFLKTLSYVSVLRSGSLEPFIRRGRVCAFVSFGLGFLQYAGFGGWGEKFSEV